MTTFQGKLKNENSFWEKLLNIITVLSLISMVMMNVLLGFRIEGLKKELLTCEKLLNEIESSEALQ